MAEVPKRVCSVSQRAYVMSFFYTVHVQFIPLLGVTVPYTKQSIIDQRSNSLHKQWIIYTMRRYFNSTQNWALLDEVGLHLGRARTGLRHARPMRGPGGKN